MKKLLLLVALGVACSAAVTWADDCVIDPVPCFGSQTINGWGCSTNCPPIHPTTGCCNYVEYRVNCDFGPDQFYRERNCYTTQKCNDPVIPRTFKCTHI